MKYVLSYLLCLAIVILPACETWGYINRGVTGVAHKISETDTNKDGRLSLGEILGLFGIGAGGIGVTTRNLMSARKKKKAFGSIEERLAAIEEKLEKKAE